MKHNSRLVAALLVVCLCFLLLVGCVAGSEHERPVTSDDKALVEENARLKSDLATLQAKYDELSVNYETVNQKLTEIEQVKEEKVEESAKHFSNEEELIEWFTTTIEKHEEELKSTLASDPVLQSMMVQALAAKDGFLVSVAMWNDYIVPMAFTPYHTYFLLFGDGQASIYKVDGEKGWRISDIGVWVLIYPNE